VTKIATYSLHYKGRTTSFPGPFAKGRDFDNILGKFGQK